MNSGMRFLLIKVVFISFQHAHRTTFLLLLRLVSSNLSSLYLLLPLRFDPMNKIHFRDKIKKHRNPLPMQKGEDFFECLHAWNPNLSFGKNARRSLTDDLRAQIYNGLNNGLTYPLCLARRTKRAISAVAPDRHSNKAHRNRPSSPVCGTFWLSLLSGFSDAPESGAFAPQAVQTPSL